MSGIVFFLILLTIGYVVGSRVERRHYKSIIDREGEANAPLVFSARTPPTDTQYAEVGLVTGSVVISVDYFKVIAAKLRGLVGGRIGAYESLIDRARREAVLRMKEEARIKNANMIFGTRFETASISKGRGRGVSSVEILAYGTAYNAELDLAPISQEST